MRTLLEWGFFLSWLGFIPKYFEEKFKFFCSMAIGLIMVEERCFDGNTRNVVIRYLQAHAKKTPFMQRYWNSTFQYVRPISTVQRVGHEAMNVAGRLFLFGWAPVWVDENYFRYIRGTVAFEKLLIDAIEFDNQRVENDKVQTVNRYQVVYRRGDSPKMLKKMAATRSGIAGIEGALAACAPSAPSSTEKTTGVDPDMRFLRWNKEDLGAPQSRSALERLSLKEEQRQVIERIKHWKDSEDWYKSRGITWKLGGLFYGAPGCGKSSFVRALAEELDMPVYIFDLASMDNDEFMKHWNNCCSGSHIVFFEDLDSIYNIRENVAAGEDGLDYSTFLNAIDGLEQMSGRLLLVTTNHVEKLDPALGIPRTDNPKRSTRPGRLDIMLEFMGLDLEGRLKLADRIFPDQPELARQMAEENEGDSAVQFQEKCAERALALYWADKT